MANLLRVGAVVVAALVAGVPASSSLAAPAAPAGATQVTGPCWGGPGNASLSVAPNPDGSHHIEVAGRRMAEDSSWRVEMVLEDDAGEDVTVLGAQAEDGRWRVSTDTRVAEGSWASFYAAVERTDQDGGDSLCLLVTEPGQPAFGAAFCGRGFNVLTTRRRDDGSAVLRYRLYGARNMGWRLTVKATDGPDDVRSMTFDDTADDRGRMATRVELTGLDAPRYSIRAVSDRGAVCWLRLDPSDVASDGGGSSPLSARELLRRARR